jgi:hypothetical protein
VHQNGKQLLLYYSFLSSTSRAGAAYHSAAPEFPPSYSGVLAAQSLVFSLVLVEQELLTILVHLSSPRLIVGFLLLNL